ncbi:MAG TPA: beta-ketoacyl-ACP synthase 3 [Candidatus Krumholzibacteria bacterium]|nr:beta-ketoacyl-ACP synthase 3 [Candidatus Krumholzibacteria bacterium]
MTLEAFIVGTGHASPGVTVESTILEAELGLEPGWIERRTGIRSRRVCSADQACSDLAIEAGIAALDDAGLDPSTVGLVVLATSTPDHLLPPTAPRVAAGIGAPGAGGFDLAGACAGFVYALGVGAGWTAAFGAPVLVVASNVLSRRLDPADAGSRAVFADGAGAVVLAPERSARPAARIRALRVGSDARHADAIRVVAGGSVHPFDADALREGLHFLRIERGSVVFQEAVRGMVRASRAALDDAGCTIHDLDAWIPHQANRRILDRAGNELGLDSARRVDILPTWGNSSAASIPTALSLHRRTTPRPGTVLLSAVGAGLLEAAAVVEWDRDDEERHP